MNVKNLILIIGYRKKAVEAALKLGYQIVVWDQKVPHSNSAKQIHHVIKDPFLADDEDVSDLIKSRLKGHLFQAVISTKESTVVTAAKVREYLQLAGNRIQTAIQCQDKLQMKNRAKKFHIPVTPFALIDHKTDSHDLIKSLGLPIVVKQRSASGSRGIQVTKSMRELKKFSKPGWLAEKYILGKEYSVESFIQNKKIFFTNITEYFQLTFCNIIPADLSLELHQKIIDFNRHIIDIFQIENGMTHLEIYLTQQGIVFGEIAIRPPGGYIMELLEIAYGFNAWEAFIKMETNNPYSFPNKSSCYSAVWLIHPGQGIVAQIAGIDEIKRLPGVKAANFRLKIGKTLKPRIGVGQDYGEVVFSAFSRAEVVQSIQECQDMLKIKLT